MDCTICLESNIKKQNMEYLQCGHSICDKCFDKLVRNLCPFCRHVIVNKEDKNYSIENILTDDDINNIFDYDTEYQVDNILPQSELNIIEDRYSTYYPITEDRILERLNKRKCKKNKKNANSFRSNKEREPWERKSKKNKKRRNMKLYQ